MMTHEKLNFNAAAFKAPLFMWQLFVFVAMVSMTSALAVVGTQPLIERDGGLFWVLVL